MEPLAEPNPASARPPSRWRIRESPSAGPFQRLVPARLAEVGERVGRIEFLVGVLGDAVLADQRPHQPVRMRDVVETEAALDAQPVAVGGAVAAVDVKQLVVADVVGELAADPAVGAERLHMAVGGPGVDAG